jgi:murein DD-endopeptidase MepM/ murein hydrolase activator NlpD
MMQRLTSPVPGAEIRIDPEGDGRYLAPRRGRRHIGVDLVAPDGCEVVATLTGRVVRLGYCYPDDLHWRLVEIEGDGLIVRVLYVEPCDEVGDFVEAGQLIGYSQGISARYSQAMLDHVHLDVRLAPSVMAFGRWGHAPSDVVYLDPLWMMGGAL